MFQNLPNLYEQANSGLYYGNFDFNFNLDAEKNLLYSDQRYLNEHYLLKHVSISSQDDSTTKKHFKAVIIDNFQMKD